MTDTIFALASGQPPAAIAIVRLSGPATVDTVKALCGRLPRERQLVHQEIVGVDGPLDFGMIVWMRGPKTVTGEDYAEIHCHGSRAVVRAIEADLARRPGLCLAEPGEFSRRGLLNGKIDLAQAEALADLLSAETELQRRLALGTAGGRLSQQVELWRRELLELSAMVEAALDFSDEEDTSEPPPDLELRMDGLRAEIEAVLQQPTVDSLNKGFRVVLAGPPNSGKSSLFNAILKDEAAIVTDIAGTTRDILERRIDVEGFSVLLQDTAGLRDDSTDVVERIGIDRSHKAVKDADLVLWLGEPDVRPEGAFQLVPKSDLGVAHCGLSVSARTGDGISELLLKIVEFCRDNTPDGSIVSLNSRQASLLHKSAELLRHPWLGHLLVLAEILRLTRGHFDRVVGRTGIEDVYDTLFGRFCIGK